MLRILLTSRSTNFVSFWPNCSQKLKRKTQYKLTSVVEMTAVFYMRRTFWKNMMDIKAVFYNENTYPMFSSVFERKKLSFLCTIIQFDNSRVRKEQWSADKFSAFPDFFERCNKQFIKLRIPLHSYAIDKTLYLYKGRIEFKQYNPSKPAKSGLLWHVLCDPIVQ